MFPKLDARAIIKHFGGARNLADMAAKSGYIIKPKAMYKWAERGSIAGYMLIILAKVAKDNNMELNLERYVE